MDFFGSDADRVLVGGMGGGVGRVFAFDFGNVAFA